MNRQTFYVSVVAGCLMMTTAPVCAEIAYVTDQLRLGVHQAADASDRAFTNISSGDRVDILEETNYYAFVKLPDGRKGWVKKNYLLADKPAALIVKEMKRERDDALGQLESLQTSLAAREARVNQMEAEVTDRAAAALAEKEELIALREIRTDLVERLEAYGFSVPGGLFFAGLAASLVIGSLLGWWWLDRRSRARHGGFRIY
ncbi:MAG: TIGR04211 family SH3 domain-containing protein [Gammaproteobacteria bacterium]|nr:MAG: TIGR04211 family SH3 domain-containing protein [Gammaproteobacteria bacterium]